MRLMILTTQTSHHAYFIKEFAKLYPFTKAVVETKSIAAPFDTSHPYLFEQKCYEEELWFGNDTPQISKIVDTLSVPSINDPSVGEFISEHAPDLVVVFGTGKINIKSIYAIPDGRLLNLHGGNPEKYRGLDTHLWTIYHGQFDQLMTCLHKVAPDLDAGDIVARKKIFLRANMGLHELRAENTKLCVQLVKEAVKKLDQTGKVDSTAQIQKGRYYSFMPSDLKEYCFHKFKQFTATL